MTFEEVMASDYGFYGLLAIITAVCLWAVIVFAKKISGEYDNKYLEKKNK